MPCYVCSSNASSYVNALAAIHVLERAYVFPRGITAPCARGCSSESVRKHCDPPAGSSFAYLKQVEFHCCPGEPRLLGQSDSAIICDSRTVCGLQSFVNECHMQAAQARQCPHQVSDNRSSTMAAVLVLQHSRYLWTWSFWLCLRLVIFHLSFGSFLLAWWWRPARRRR